MKAIIYAGIGLFSVATVYGLADYYSSQKKGALDKLYLEEETAPVIVPEEKTTVTLPEKMEMVKAAEVKTVAKKTTPAKKQKLAKRKINMEDFSRGRIPDRIVEVKLPEEPLKKIEVMEPAKPENPPVGKIEVKEEPVERKISLDMYSRAPLKKMKVAKKSEVKD